MNQDRIPIIQNSWHKAYKGVLVFQLRGRDKESWTKEEAQDDFTRRNEEAQDDFIRRNEEADLLFFESLYLYICSQSWESPFNRYILFGFYGLRLFILYCVTLQRNWFLYTLIILLYLK